MSPSGDRQREPHQRPDIILNRTAARRIHRADIVLRTVYPRVTGPIVNLVGRTPIPPKCLDVVLGNKKALFVSNTDHIFRVGRALIRGDAIPFKRFAEVLRHPASLRKDIREIVLGYHRALIRSKTKPFRRFRFVTRGAPALLKQNPNFVLCVR